MALFLSPLHNDVLLLQVAKMMPKKPLLWLLATTLLQRITTSLQRILATAWPIIHNDLRILLDYSNPDSSWRFAALKNPSSDNCLHTSLMVS